MGRYITESNVYCNGCLSALIEGNRNSCKKPSNVSAIFILLQVHKKKIKNTIKLKHSISSNTKLVSALQEIKWKKLGNYVTD